MSAAIELPVTPVRFNAEEILQRARAVTPRLRELAQQAEQLRRVPDESMALLKDNGLLRTIQPLSCGGHGLSMRSHLDVVSTVGEGCGSTAWVLGVGHAHSWLMGHFPKQAQQEVYGKDPDTLVSAVIGPRGKAIRQADGSYVLNGIWPFGSGCQHADWLALGAVVYDEAGTAIDEADLLVPASEIVIRDDWFVAGLQGSGSNTMLAKDVRVPAHRYLSMPALMQRQTPPFGERDADWFARAQPVPVLAFCLVGGALGIARGALADFKRGVKGKRILYTSNHIADEWIPTQIALAHAAAMIHAAELVLYRAADDIDEHAQVGMAMPLEMRARIRMDCAFAARLLMDAVDKLMLQGGASALQLSNGLQRAARDLRATNMHGLLLLETNAEIYGRVLFGKDPATPLV
jgi:3-hydroxy-9,10-secoandrosta-1,3,5(10)-triene-9,17-dione monooxygenase